MKTLLSLSMAVGVTLAAGAAPAGPPLLSALNGAPGCGHVLDLLMRYGGLEGLPGPAGGAVLPSPHGDFVMPLAELGDLCVGVVTELPQADPACPPTFVVAVTNHSQRDVCNVHVSVVALLGPIKPLDPTATVCVDAVPAGATVEVQLTLPDEALAMGSNGGVLVGFNKLLVAVDSFDRFVELDEANNLSLLCRADVPQHVVTVETTETEVVAPAEGGVEALPPTPQESTGAPAIDDALEKFGLDVSGTEAAAERL